MASNLMVYNGAAYVLDCGIGVTNEYARTGIPFSALRSIFITHHHPDHNIEYGPLLIIGWVSGMRQSVRAYGPPPLAQMTEDNFRSAKATIGFWAEDFHMSPLRTIEVYEIPNSGPVMQDDTVNVTSILVQHPPVKPALGYRFDFPDRSIAFSGDTVALEAIAQMAKGADSSRSTSNVKLGPGSMPMATVSTSSSQAPRRRTGATGTGRVGSSAGSVWAPSRMCH
jgi:ribonuclease BN (tRNA processing enzyme)